MNQQLSICVCDRAKGRRLGASAIKCCYAAAGSGTGVEETELRAQLS